MRGRRAGKRTGTPGGMQWVLTPPSPGSGMSLCDKQQVVRKGDWNRKHPILSEGGIFLKVREIQAKIRAEREVTDLKDIDFMEDIDDQIGAYAEVRRRFNGTRSQAQRLSDIYRRATQAEAQ